ncbi:MAG: Fic family protein [Lactobacillaceae bacterium]|jgi:Fic family protein|nr:Fic family protein [Lactobacillaceae bacterium]
MSSIQNLPVEDIDIETKTVLQKLTTASRSLGLLQGKAKLIPNQSMLINFMALREAKASSEIEQIVTTNDRLFRAMSNDDEADPSTKEVLNYRFAILEGYRRIKERGLLSINDMISIQERIEQNKGGIRSAPGTTLKNAKTGEVVWTPPQNETEIRELLQNLEQYINDDDLQQIDPLLKLVFIHYQFEAIHPFYDGNGRTGRIINVLYLVLKDLLDLPILYLSSYILESKSEYYELLRNINQDTRKIVEFASYILDGIQQTSEKTNLIIDQIQDSISQASQKIKENNNSLFSYELVSAIFSEVVTRIDAVATSLDVTRQTASRYLKELVELEILEEIKVGREKIYLNKYLAALMK